jgi:hypothetical protein
MQYLLLIIGFHQPEAGTQADGVPSVEEFGAYDQSVRDAGVYVDGKALAGTDVATTVQVRPDGERVVTDGPFAETREFVGGYYLIDVADLDVAIDWAGRCPGAKYGRVEVRPVVTF